MPVLCLYLQIHQPFRLRKYTVFDSDASYFDQGMNAQLVERIAERCYVPMNRLLLELIGRHGIKFRFALSVTGTAIEQFEAYAPQVMQGLHALAETGQVEFLGETFYHSLGALYSREEFAQQVHLHKEMIHRLFGQEPTVFRNTELIYSDDIAAQAAELGFTTVLAEGWDPVLNNRSAAFLYRAAKSDVALLLRNYHLSDAIAFRFSDPTSADFPLTDEKFSNAVGQIGGQLCNLFMDYETFGEHQPAASGIFDFMRALPGRLLHDHSEFRFPSEIAASAQRAGELGVPHPISWADESRDLSAWLGNAMQANAVAELYKLEGAVKSRADARLLADWRKLTTSDHLYYMSTRQGPGGADGRVHDYFRPYDSPYDAYINFMNVLDNVRARAG